MTNEEINAKVAEIRKLEAEAEKVKKQVDKLKEELKAECDSRNVEKIETGLHNIFYKCSSQKRIDSDKLKAAGLYDQFLKEIVSLKFQITDVKIV